MSLKTVFLSLTAALVTAACSSAPRPRSVDVDFLWVRQVPEVRGYEGGTNHAVLRVEPSDSGMLVGLFESQPAGMGAMWRCAAWVAALTATFELGLNPLHYRYSIETDAAADRIDGPSAGGLFAVAIMAALTGETIRPEATMTGTVNPDGTVGPVGGVAEKLRAAQRIGKKRFCYPAGIRKETQAGSDEKIDIEALAKELGVEAVPIRDLPEGYACLTGKHLSLRQPLPRTAMALDSSFFQHLSVLTSSSLARTTKLLKESPKPFAEEHVQSKWDEVSRCLARSSEYLQEGWVGAAWDQSVRAYSLALTQQMTSRVAELLLKTDLVGALNLYEDSATRVDKALSELTQEFGELPLDSLDRTVLLLSAYEAAISATVHAGYGAIAFKEILSKMAQDLLEKEDQRFVKLLTRLFAPVEDLARAEAQISVAQEILTLAQHMKGTGSVSEADLEAASRLFGGAAAANLEYIDALWIQDESEQTGKPVAEVRKNLAQKDLHYRLALLNLKLPETSKLLAAGEGRPRWLARLSGALSSFFASSTLVATRFSLIVDQVNEQTPEDGQEEEGALKAALRFAEHRARENAAYCRQKTGLVPQMALMDYQIALLLEREMGREDRALALEYFWRSSMWSQVAAFLAESRAQRR